MKEGESGVVGSEASADLEEVGEHLSLSGEGVHHVLFVVRHRRLEEERQIRQNWTKSLPVDSHSTQELPQNHQVDHYRSSQQ